MSSDRTWRATIPDSIYDQIRRIHSADELLRQEVIFELCQTEESFVNGLKGVVRLFSQPLRTPHGKWIAGVPFNVSRLFDSLNDIVYLHSHLVDALRQNKLAQGALVLRFADTFQPYVSRLEVHQAYLVRFEGVTREIEDLARKPDSEFGEFVRMQQGLPECGAMTLSSFLLKPVQRLMKYPLFFKVSLGAFSCFPCALLTMLETSNSAILRLRSTQTTTYRRSFWKAQTRSSESWKRPRLGKTSTRRCELKPIWAR
jgi:hypothetical protein